MTREVYMLFTEAFFSSAVGLFTLTNSDEVWYTIDPRSGAAPETVEFYQFAGRVFGKALIDGYNIGARLAPPLLKQLLRIPVEPADLAQIEPEMHRSLEWMRINPIQDVIFEHFTVEIPGAEVDQVRLTP